jgi:hypothetical protein
MNVGPEKPPSQVPALHFPVWFLNVSARVEVRATRGSNVQTTMYVCFSTFPIRTSKPSKGYEKVLWLSSSLQDNLLDKISHYMFLSIRMIHAHNRRQVWHNFHSNRKYLCKKKKFLLHSKTRAIQVRSPAEPKDFSSSLCVQTGSGTHPASCTIGTGGRFPGAKARPGRNADHSPHLMPRFWMSRSYTASPHAPP